MTARSLPARLLALLLALSLGPAGTGCEVGSSLSPSSGLPEYQRGGLVPVPGGAVNAAGGNLLVERLDLSIDTPLGARELRATYDALSGAWLWSFEIRYDGGVFVAPSGAIHDVGALADGAPIEGSVWLKRDAERIETRGGLVHHFDAAGRLDRIHWRGVDHPRLEYAWGASRLDVALCPRSSACHDLLEIDLDAEGRPVALRDLRSGREAEMEWDGLGRLVTARGPADVASGRPGIRYEYASGGTLLTAQTSSEGERIEYRYQAGRRIREVTRVGEEHPTHRFSFLGENAEGLYPSVHRDPLGARTRLYFDAERRLRRIHWLETGEVLTQEWQGPRVVERVQPDGVSTGFGWQDDELVSVQEPSGNLVLWSYEPDAIDPGRPQRRPVRRVDDSLGPVEERDYDGQGRLVAIRNGEGEEMALAYHAGTALASLTAADGVWLGFPRYGLHGHWLEREGASADRRAFDPVGNPVVTASLERGGGVLSRLWDPDRSLAGLELAASEGGRVSASAQLTLVRRSDGRLLRVERPGGGDHEFVYDAIGRLVERRERVDGAWHATLYQRDALGRLTARTRPNGMREEWEYDARGRLLRLRALRDGQLEGEELLSWSDGRLAARFDSLRGTSEVYGYDAAGRRDRIWFGYGETLDLEWDLRSRLLRQVLTLPGQGPILEIEYGYDLADRQLAIRADGSEDLVLRSYAEGRLVSTRYGNGLVRDLDYQSGLLSGASSTDAFGETIEVTDIERSLEAGPPRSQIATATTTPLGTTEEEFWLGAGTHPSIPEQRMGKRVFGWRGVVAGQPGERAFAYDLLGNPADDADGDRFTTNAEGNRLLRAELASEGQILDYGWDPAGFAVSRGGVPIEWTATGRLASHGDVEIQWDMQGRPIAWTANGLSRDFALFGGRVDRDPQSGVLGSFDLGEVSVGFGGQRRYRHGDFRGNVRFVSDEDGQVVSHYAYTPYGVDAVLGVDEGLALAGGRVLGALVWLGARIYDPAVGRFLSPDPVFRLVNQYAYAMGNPVWFRDPGGDHEGATGEDVGAAAVGVVLATLGVIAVTPTTPAWAVGLAFVAFYWAAIGFAVSFSSWRESANSNVSSPGTENRSDTGAAVRSAPAGGPSTGGLAFGGPGPAGCAPTRLARAPDLGWLLYGLLPLQLLAALAWLRRRRRAGSAAP